MARTVRKGKMAKKTPFSNFDSRRNPTSLFLSPFIYLFPFPDSLSTFLSLKKKKETMDLSEVAKKLGMSPNKELLRKAAELRRLCDVRFDSSIIGVGEVCKAIICLEIAASRYQVIFNRQDAVRLSGMSEKAYTRSFNSLQNNLGVKNTLDVRQLGIQFGCIRLIPFVTKGLALYKDRFVASLPPSRRVGADCSRPIFTAVAFYLCAKKHKLKVDKTKLIEVCGTSESEFKCVSASMEDLCHDVFGTAKEKKDPREVKGNRDLLDVLPEKRQFEDGGYSSDDGTEDSSYKKRKRKEKADYNNWKSSVLSSKRKSSKDSAGQCKRTKQIRLSFEKKNPESAQLGAS